MWLKTYLILTGIGALIALAMPWIVVIASFLVLPGLILGSMPTAFMYGIAFAVIRILLGNYIADIPLNLLSAAATLALFWAIPQPGLISARASLAAVKQPDIRAETPIAFRGHILVIRPFESGCDELCAALLKTPGVTSVRVAVPDRQSNTYRIVPSSTPGTRAKATGYGLLEDTKFDARAPLARRRALEAEWNLMLSEGKALIVSSDSQVPNFTITIEDGPALPDSKRRSGPLDWTLQPSPPHRKALSVTNDNGQVLLRQSIVSIFAPVAPLFIGASGGVENFRFGWQRTRLGDGEDYSEVPIDRVFLDHSNVARGVDMAAAEVKAREEITRALNDPLRPMGHPSFSLANQWMGSFEGNKQPLSESDRHLLASIVADARVPSSDGLWAIVARVDDDSSDLRRLAARRYLAAEDKKKERHWINVLAALPPGAYANPLPEERDILAQPATSLYATGLIERQGDRGAEAVPDLLRLLREFSTFDPGKYGFSDLTEATSAVRRGFRRIGPTAAGARPEIEALLASPGLEYRYRKLGKRDWDTLLIVFGRSPETLSKPESLGGTDASYREKIARSAAEPYDPRRD